MRSKRRTARALMIVVMAVGSASIVCADQPSATAFTYTGTLSRAGASADGSYDMEVRLYDAPTDGNILGTVSLGSVQVHKGTFEVVLDFGLGTPSCGGRWLETSVRAEGADDFTVLNPRQPLKVLEDCNVPGNLTVTGNVAIGMTNPDPSLFQVAIDGRLGLTNSSELWIGGVGDSRIGELRSNSGDLQLIADGTRDVTIGSGAQPDSLVVDGGNGYTSVRVLQITGGADLAERFPLREEVEPGMLVEIDPDEPGQLRLARDPYSPLVAGVISGANGLSAGAVLGSDSADGGAPAVALTGRVYCWADASYGSIEPGDLLTTSGTPGYAMKVKKHSRARGAVVGKAMSRLEAGHGLVLILVQPQ